jgi:hypothetical protein
MGWRAKPLTMERMRLLTPSRADHGGGEEGERERGHTGDIVFCCPEVHDIQRANLEGEVDEGFVHAGDGDRLEAREGVDEGIEF